MKRVLLLFVLLFTLVACGGEEPTATPAPAPTQLPPTVATPVEPTATEVPGSSIDSLEHTPDLNLVDKAWLWERRDPNGKDSPEIVVLRPELYSLVFNEDGTYSAKMDCNQAVGRYATSSPGIIIMEPGPSTAAACGEGSLDTTMSQMFGPAQGYRFEEGGAVLVFAWAADGPLDYYRNILTVDLPDPGAGEPTGTVTAPDGIFLRTGPGTSYPYVGVAARGDSGEIIGVSQDGLWWLASAPNQPGGQVWASAEFVETIGTENVPVVAAPSTEPALVKTPWIWVSTTDPAAGTTPVYEPDRYIVLFNDDGTADIQADCNLVQGTYEADESGINIMTGPSTLAQCPPNSLDSQFLAQLTGAAIWFIEGGNLYLDLPVDSGTMRFVPQGTAPPAESPPAGEAEAGTFYLVSFGPADAPQPVIPGSQITLHFAGNQATGSAGCNNYSGILTPVENYFIITAILVTQMLCSEPAGVMEQEQAFLAGLQSLTGYQWVQTPVNNVTLVTQGQLFYTLPDGTPGLMNFVSSP